MAATFDTIDTISVSTDAHGVIRISGTRVTLDTIIHAFQRGESAEQIAQSFPVVPLSDVYQVIGYYHKHKQELDEYLRRGEEEAAALLAENIDQWSPVGMRERLLARRQQKP